MGEGIRKARNSGPRGKEDRGFGEINWAVGCLLFTSLFVIRYYLLHSPRE